MSREDLRITPSPHIRYESVPFIWPQLTISRWVFSSQLSATSQSGHSVFNPSASSTFKDLPGYTWNITYGDKSGASGNVGTDVVKVGSTSVTGQAVELAQQVSAQFVRDTDNDGLLGLAFSKINTGEQLNLHAVGSSVYEQNIGTNICIQ